MTNPRPTALITGASSGIGRDLALIFAQAGHDLAIVARNADALNQLAAECHQNYQSRVEVLPADLSHPDSPQRIFDHLSQKHFPIDILVNNAGFGDLGSFLEVPWQRQHDMLQVNMTSLLLLTRLFLPPMIQRQSGRILNVASTAAFIAGPRLGLYCASKAFLLSHSLALAQELRGTGVKVTVLCPGPTQTDFQNRAGMANTDLFRTSVMRSMDVARIGYKGLMKGKHIVVPGLFNKFAVFATRLLPRTTLAKLVGRLNRTPAH